MSIIRTHLQSEEWYAGIDAGIRFPVRVLHAAGLDTLQSCQGGHGHDYDRPTVDLPCADDDGAGFRALAALTEYGLEVRDVSMMWSVHRGLPSDRIWRVTLRRTWEERADEAVTFASGSVNLCACGCGVSAGAQGVGAARFRRD